MPFLMHNVRLITEKDPHRSLRLNCKSFVKSYSVVEIVAVLLAGVKRESYCGAVL